MKKKLSFLVVFVLICSLAVSLAACGGSKATFTANGKVVGNITTGKIISPPKGSSSIGYVFLGWYESETASVPYDFSQSVAGDKAFIAKFYDVAGDKTVTSFTALAPEDIIGQYRLYDELGEVINYAKVTGGYVFTAKGYKGYHMEDNPSVTVSVFVKSDGIIGNISIVEMKAQTDDVVATLTQARVTAKYKNKPLSVDINVGTIATGATLTSDAVGYAVKAVANYIMGTKLMKLHDFTAEYTEIVNGVYAATYTPITEGPAIDRVLGKVLFAANGVGGGKNVMALIVENTDFTEPDITGSEAYFGSCFPDKVRTVIVIDKATNKVIAEKILNTGVTEEEYFTTPQSYIDKYKEVTISNANAFDNFTDGLYKPVHPLSPDPNNMVTTIITGTSIIYTGATQYGTFSSQYLRFCYMVAARFYTATK